LIYQKRKNQLNNHPMKKLIKGAIIVLILVITCIWYFIFYHPSCYKRDVAKENSVIVNAVNMVKQYKENEDSANLKYLNKVVEIKGIISSVDKNQKGEVTLILKGPDEFSNVFLTLQNNKNRVNPGESVVLKGICTGYLMDVIVIDAIVIS